jgi:hypothetical protein
MRAPWNKTCRITSGSAFGSVVKARGVPCRFVRADSVFPVGASIGYDLWVTMPTSTPVRGGQDTTYGAFDLNKSDVVYDEVDAHDVGKVLWVEDWSPLDGGAYYRSYCKAIESIIYPQCCLAGVPSFLIVRVVPPTSNPDYLGASWSIIYDPFTLQWTGSFVTSGGATLFVELDCAAPLWVSRFSTPDFALASATGPAGCGPVLISVDYAYGLDHFAFTVSTA